MLWECTAWSGSCIASLAGRTALAAPLGCIRAMKVAIGPVLLGDASAVQDIFAGHTCIIFTC